MSEKKAYKSWTISDELWEQVEEYIPETQRDPNKEYKCAPRSGTPENRAAQGIGRDILCPAYGLPMEGSTQGIWKRKYHPPDISGVATCGIL